MSQAAPAQAAADGSSPWYLYRVVMIAAVGGFLFGYDLQIISGAMIFLKTEFQLTPNAVGFATGSALLGCLTGPLLLAAGLSDWLGRKKVLAITATLFGVGAIGSALPQTIGEFNFFRILGGIGVGVASVVSPMYIAEIAPARIRGRMVTVNQLAIVVGCLCAFVAAYFLSFTGSWRWMFASCCVPVAVLLVGLVLVPESPRWLVENNRLGEASAVLSRINGRAQAQQDMRDIAASLAEETGGYRELFQPGMRMALLIAVVLAVLQQWTGVSILSFYTPMLFQKAGFTAASDAILQSLIVNAWNLMCTVLALWLVDRLGRKPLLLTGCAGMALGLFLLGLVFACDLNGIVVLVIYALCVGAYVTSLAPLAWVIMSEIFPTRIRGRAMSIATVSLWLASYLGVQAFPPLVAFLEDQFGSAAGVFWIYACVSAFALVFVWQIVPETKGRTLEEIGRSWTRGIAGS
jgi:MFS transporter, SP family, arabinose:H+ symporter